MTMTGCSFLLKNGYVQPGFRFPTTADQKYHPLWDDEFKLSYSVLMQPAVVPAPYLGIGFVVKE